MPIPDNDLGTRMRVALATVGRRGKDVAGVMGIDPGTLSKYLNGVQKPGPDALASFVRVLGVNGHWLLTSEGEPYPVAPGVKEAAFEEVVEIVRRVTGTPRPVPVEVVDHAKESGDVDGDGPGLPQGAEGS